MKLALQLGYWGAAPIVDAPELIAAAEEAGFDAVFTAESWGSDAYTPLAWWGAATSRIRLGSAVAQLSARPPTSLAMHALTLDHLSGGRHILGLGVSGPQVVEGWYGEPFAKPLARTREYVSIVRKVLARNEPVTLADGRTLKATFEGSDADTDVALIRIPPKDLTQIPLGDSDKISVGQKAVAMGAPFGLEFSVSEGIVSADADGVTTADGAEAYADALEAVGVPAVINGAGSVFGTDALTL